MIDLKKYKRRLIGGIWVKHSYKNGFDYCVRSQGDWLSSYNVETKLYSGFGDTNVAIEHLEDYGAITKFGKFLGYTDESPRKGARMSILERIPAEVGIIMIVIGIYGACHSLTELASLLKK